MSKRILLVLFVSLMFLSPLARADHYAIEQAIDNAVARISEDLGRTSFPAVERIAVLPVLGDPYDYATEGLRSAVTRTDYRLFTREDETWNALLAEIEWSVRREDVMDAETIQKFGRIEGVQAIMYGRIWDASPNLWGTFGHVKISVSLAEVETGEILWSSGPVEGEGYIHWASAATRFWRYPVMTVAVIIGLLVVLLVFRFILKGIAHATRPL